MMREATTAQSGGTAVIKSLQANTTCAHFITSSFIIMQGDDALGFVGVDHVAFHTTFVPRLFPIGQWPPLVTHETSSFRIARSLAATSVV